MLLVTPTISVGEYYCGVGIRDPIRGMDVIVENCTNIGTFSIGGLYEGQWERLTYNYPMPWRGTFISVRAGNITYSNSVQPKGKKSLDDYVAQHPKIEGNTIATRWRLPENLIVEQRIEVLDNLTRIRIRATNANPNPLRVGIRLHLDTMLGYNDGAPIYIHGKGMQEYEREYSKQDMGFGYWRAYEKEGDQEVVSTGAIQNDNLTYTTPGELILTNWKRSMRSAWDYSADNSIPITGDSAVILRYPEEELLPGESREVVFGYGKGIIETEPATTTPTAIAPTTLSVSKELRIKRIFVDKQGSYCPKESVMVGVDLENGNKENSGTVKVEIKDAEGKTFFVERKGTGILDPGWTGVIKFIWRAADVELKEFTVISTLYDSKNRETDRKTTRIRVDRLSCPMGVGAINPIVFGILMALALVVLIYLIYVKVPHGRVEIKKLKNGEFSKVIVWNKTNHPLNNCVLHDDLVRGAEVSVSTINVYRHGNSLTWNIGTLEPGEKAVLEYRIKGANVLPKARLSWEGGWAESS